MIFWGSQSSFFDDVKAHLARISCLQLNLDSIHFSLEPILWACIQHLTPYSWCIRWPDQSINQSIKSSHIIQIMNYTNVFTMQWNRSCSSGSYPRWWNQNHRLRIGIHSRGWSFRNHRKSLLDSQAFRFELPEPSRQSWTRCTYKSSLLSAP